MQINDSLGCLAGLMVPLMLLGQQMSAQKQGFTQPLSMMLVMSFMGHAVMPIFGVFLTGIPATAFFVFFAALWAYAAWSLYKLNMCGWWVLFFAICIFSVSGIVTFAHHNIMEMYRLMGYPQPMLEQLQKTNPFTGNSMMWLMLAGAIPFLGYLLFIKRYFRRLA